MKTYEMTGSIDTQRKEFEEFKTKLEELDKDVMDEQDKAYSPGRQNEALRKR